MKEVALEKKIKEAQENYIASIRKGILKNYKEALEALESFGNSALANVYFMMPSSLETRWTIDLDAIDTLFNGEKEQFFESAYPVMIVGQLAKGFKDKRGKESTKNFSVRFQKGLTHIDPDKKGKKERVRNYCRYTALCIRNVDGLSLKMRHSLLCFVYGLMMKKSSIDKEEITKYLVEETVDHYLTVQSQEDRDGFEKLLVTKFDDKHYEYFRNLLKDCAIRNYDWRYPENKIPEDCIMGGQPTQPPKQAPEGDQISYGQDTAHASINENETAGEGDEIPKGTSEKKWYKSIRLKWSWGSFCLGVGAALLIAIIAQFFFNKSSAPHISSTGESEIPASESSITDSYMESESLAADESNLTISQKEYTLTIGRRRMIRSTTDTTNDENIIFALETGSTVIVLDDSIGDGWARVRYEIVQKEDGYTFESHCEGYLKIMPEFDYTDSSMAAALQGTPDGVQVNERK